MENNKTDYSIYEDASVDSIKPKSAYQLESVLNTKIFAWIKRDSPPFQLKILDERITPDTLKPEHSMSAAFDLRACISKPVAIPPLKSILIPTGIAIFINDPHIAGCIVPRSGTGHKRGLILGNGFGLIDGDYQGQWMVSALNRNEDIYIEINPMERIAQAFFIPVFHPNFRIVEEFSAITERGESSFGSTGK